MENQKDTEKVLKLILLYENKLMKATNIEI